MKYIEDGHAEVVPNDDLHNEGRFFLIHHRDGSKDFWGQSFNKNIMPCHDVLERVPGVLMRFRTDSVAVGGDLKSFFHNVNVPTEHFLWYKNNNIDGEVVQYRMKVQCFRGTASQAPLIMVLHHAIKKQIDSGWTTEESCFYSYDFLASFLNSEDAVKQVTKTIEPLGLNGFKVRGFVSNVKDVMHRLNELCLESKENNGQASVLGLQWDLEKDEIGLRVQFKPPRRFHCTKREVLSNLMSIWDPLGILIPYTLSLKLVVQHLVILGLNGTTN